MAYDTVALIGIGNIMFHDEGLGAYAVAYIEANYEIPPNLTVVEGGTLGFTLMTYYQEYDKIIIVGTGSKEGEAGTIFSETQEEVLQQGSIRQTANEAEITMMLEICSFHEAMGEVQMITMIPQDIIEVKNGLSPEVLAHMPELIEAIRSELARTGIALRRNKEPEVSFASIIETYANPKQPFDYAR